MADIARRRIASRETIAAAAILVSLGSVIGQMTLGPAPTLFIVGALLVIITAVLKRTVALVLTVIFAFGTFPAQVPTSFNLGSFTVNIFEIFLVICATQAAATKPRTRQQRRPFSVTMISVFFAAVALGVLVGLLRFSPLEVASDIRFLIDVALGVFVWRRLSGHISSTRMLTCIRWVLCCSAAMSIAAALGMITVNGRSGNTQLWSTTGVQLSATAADRFLTPTGFLAVAVICGAIGSLLYGRWGAKTVATLVLPACTIVALSYSRNSIVAVSAAVALLLFAAAVRQSFLPVVCRVVGTAMVILAIAMAAFWVSQLTPLASVVNSSIEAYASRVIDGLNPSVRAVDTSTQDRLLENDYLARAAAQFGPLGSGYGYAYLPALGAEGSFAATGGRYYAHNYYFWTLAKAGWLGLGALVVMLIATVTRGMRQRTHEGPLVAIALGSLAPVMFIAPLMNSPHNGLLIGALIGATVHFSPGPRTVHVDRDYAYASSGVRT